MKRLIAIALVALFSVLMSGSVYASFDDKVSIELKRDMNKLQFDLIHDVFTPDVTPKFGQSETIVLLSDGKSGFRSDIEQRANSPPLLV